MTEPDSSPTETSRTKFVFIVSIAIVPIVIAYFVFFNYPELMPRSTTNNGVLIEPPIQLQDDNLDVGEKWALLIPAESNCDDICQNSLYLTRQIHIGLGRNASRIVRLLLVEGELSPSFKQLLKEHPKLKVVDGSRSLQRLAELVPGIKNVVYLVDPHGNVMMYYLPEQLGKPMLKDLKQLLKLSNIG